MGENELYVVVETGGSPELIKGLGEYRLGRPFVFDNKEAAEKDCKKAAAPFEGYVTNCNYVVKTVAEAKALFRDDYYRYEIDRLILLYGIKHK